MASVNACYNVVPEIRIKEKSKEFEIGQWPKVITSVTTPVPEFET